MKSYKNLNRADLTCSFRVLLTGICMLTFLISFSGCAEKSDVEKSELFITQSEQDVSSKELSLNKSDVLYIAHVIRTKSDYLVQDSRGWSNGSSQSRSDIEDDLAYIKRKSALCMARGFYTYKFYNYFHMDGVSAFIYNLAYLVSVPNKLLRGIRCSDGVLGYLGNVCKLILGTIAALIGLVLSTLAGIIFHPWQSLANCTIGLFYFGDNWWSYVFNTNLLATLWDVIWGAIIYPLWQLVMFWA